ncbi:glycine--tRNA ligase subunit beta, partial [Dokdonella sp.]|uniref:glycine--tRNA ligase subunit beta n=1 Tax=Dokdonella sp. TaxID=2291710 RepID=UPI002F4285E8
DTLAGIFAAGMKPSGNKDPFALRRAALGLARTLIEGGLALDLRAQFDEALAQLPEAALVAGVPKGKDGRAPAFDPAGRRSAIAAELYDFVLDRLRGYYVDRGTPAEAFEAVRALAPGDLADFDQRLRAVVAFASLPEARALAAANKRIGNLLRQAAGPGARAIDAALLEVAAERTLHDAHAAALADVAPLAQRRDYVGVLKRLAKLREPIDRYFDEVMVMVDDERVRANRLALLGAVADSFLRVADIALLPAA